MKEKESLKQVLQKIPGKVALTSNLWASKQNVWYIAITSHYIDSDWVMQKRIISFPLLEFPHTSAGIRSTILKKLREYNIKNKIIAITLDNVNTNNVAVDLLKPRGGKLRPDPPNRPDPRITHLTRPV